MSTEKRPQCCDLAKATETMAWWLEDDWYMEAAKDARPGWAIVSGFGWGDRGGKTEPEYARANFCPFCGSALALRARGYDVPEAIVADENGFLDGEPPTLSPSANSDPETR